jgi:hypothetical protein
MLIVIVIVETITPPPPFQVKWSVPNSNSRNKEAACIIENGEHHYNAIDQTNSFARFFEDLAIP